MKSKTIPRGADLTDDDLRARSYGYKHVADTFTALLADKVEALQDIARAALKGAHNAD